MSSVLSNDPSPPELHNAGAAKSGTPAAHLLERSFCTTTNAASWIPGRTLGACPEEAPIPLNAVRPFQPATCSRPGPALELGDGVFRNSPIGKYDPHSTFASPDSISLSSGPTLTPLMQNATSTTSRPEHRSAQRTSQPGRIVESTLEAPGSSASVAPTPASVHHSRLGPECRCGSGVFQLAATGKYNHDLASPFPDIVPTSSCPSGTAASGQWGSSSLHGQPRTTSRKADEIWIYYQNVRGVRTKIDDLFLATNDCNLDVIILAETGLDECIDSLQLFGTSYNVYRCDRSAKNSRKTSFGGVLIAVAQQYPSSMIVLKNGQNLEQICISSVIKGQKLLLMAVYIPPDRSQDVSIVDAHIASVQELYDKGSPDEKILVCGDYNQPRLSWTRGAQGLRYDNSTPLPPAATALVDGFDFLNMSQANENLNHLGRVLDLVYFSSDNVINVSRAVVPLLPVDSHHPPLDISVAVSHVQQIIPTQGDTLPLNYRRLDFEALTEYLSNVDWDEMFNVHDVDIMTERFCDTICTWLNENLPTIRPPVNPPWSNGELRKLKRERNARQRLLRSHRSDNNQRAFKVASDAYRRLNAVLYKSHVMRVQFGLRRDPKRFWNFVNSKRKCSSIPSNVFLDESESSSVGESCELFAKHFASVFRPGLTSQQEAEAAASNLPADVVDIDTFNVTSDMILAASRKLKSSYSPGPDGVPAVILCRCAASLAAPLGLIFNKSFEQKRFPDLWKQSFMFPVYKKGDKRNVKNYRGITSLSAGSKLFEIIVSNVILSCTKNYISFNQHGFMPGRSVTTNLLDFTNTCISQIEAKAQVDAVYTDLKAAFDVIDHRILLCKLSRLGASDRLTLWLESYLSNRVLRVKLESSVSCAFYNKSGVPQGSNFGPLLFALFFNDVVQLLGSGFVLVYADDLKIYLVVKSMEDCFRLQGLLDSFSNWCMLNKLVISIHKCVVITFNRSKSPIIFDYRINGNVLERVDQVKDLGVVLDTKLTFNQHISTIISKASRQLGFITKISHDFTDPHCLKALYCALVRPILENAAVVWTPHHTSWDIRIERVQRRFIRIALRSLPWRDAQNLPPYIERCRLLGLDSLQRRRKIQQASTIAKLLNGEIDAPALLSRIDFRAIGRQLRSSSLLSTRFHRTSYGSNEPLTSCSRTFSLVEELFDFGETARAFVRKLTTSRML